MCIMTTPKEYSRTQPEDDRQLLATGRQPPTFDKWKTTSIFWSLEDDLIFLLQN
jgi:hypothetical protein